MVLPNTRQKRSVSRRADARRLDSRHKGENEGGTGRERTIARSYLSDGPDALGVCLVELVALFCAAACRQRMGGGDPGRQSTAQRADRPIAAPDDAIPAEAPD